MDWLQVWNDKSKTENMFDQMGRRDYTPFQFLVMCKDIAEKLEFNHDDIVLDIGAGVGWTSFYIAPFVKEITAFDYAEELVEIGLPAMKHYSNLRILRDNMLIMGHVRDRKYTKAMAGGCPFQYLNDYDEVKQALKNIFDVMEVNGRLLITHIGNEANRWENSNFLWFSSEWLHDVMREIGFRFGKIYPVNEALSTQAWYTFDLMVIK
jgi:ubiquinone/menaquinone biosynthesis C-methylase UbiE